MVPEGVTAVCVGEGQGDCIVGDVVHNGPAGMDNERRIEMYLEHPIDTFYLGQDGDVCPLPFLCALAPPLLCAFNFSFFICCTLDQVSASECLVVLTGRFLSAPAALLRPSFWVPVNHPSGEHALSSELHPESAGSHRQRQRVRF